jgi:hypothetical protein
MNRLHFNRFNMEARESHANTFDANIRIGEPILAGMTHE